MYLIYSLRSKSYVGACRAFGTPFEPDIAPSYRYIHFLHLFTKSSINFLSKYFVPMILNYAVNVIAFPPVHFLVKDTSTK